MGRHERRKNTALMRAEVAHASLLTWLVPADTPLADPLLRRAIKFWRGNIQARRPFCPACRANYADNAEVGAFLLAVPTSSPTAALVSAFCVDCVGEMPRDEVERHATRVLRHLIPDGRFLDGVA
jgi:hypothetical protein